MSDFDKETNAVDQLVELFLELPIMPPIEKDDNFEAQRQENDALERCAWRDQYFKAQAIAKEVDGFGYGHMLRFFQKAQLKAYNRILWHGMVAQTIEPDSMRELGVPEHIIENAKAVHDYMKDEAKMPYKEGARKGGQGRSLEQQKNYNTHKHYWEEWQKNPSIYKNITAYDEAMRDKTGSSLNTIRSHRKGFANTTNK